MQRYWLEVIYDGEVQFRVTADGCMERGENATPEKIKAAFDQSFPEADRKDVTAFIAFLGAGYPIEAPLPFWVREQGF